MNIEKFNKTETMSSIEIAELTGKVHKDVARDIRVVLEQAEIEASQFCSPFKMPSGQTAQVYRLPKRECDIVISGYSVKYRMAIIDRWHELEAANKHTIPATFSEALLLAANIQKENEALEAQVALDAPKVAFADHVVAQNTSLRIGEYAKVLSDQFGVKVGPNKLFAWLRIAGYLMKGRDNREYNKPYQESVKSGLFEHKLEKTRTGMVNVTYITGKGQFELADAIMADFIDD